MSHEEQRSIKVGNRESTWTISSDQPRRHVPHSHQPTTKLDLAEVDDQFRAPATKSRDRVTFRVFFFFFFFHVSITRE